VVAIESICAPVCGGETLDDLASLVDNSLLRQLETEGEPRFDMLKTIRGYAAERLEDQPDLSAATQRAHATYFAAFAQRQWEHLTGPRREPVLAAMAADFANLRGSWHYWVVAKDLAQLNKLVDSLWLFYDAQGWYHATVQVATDLLTVLSSTSSSPERAMQEVLRTSLARALMAIHGYTREVEDAYGHALEVVEGQREVPQLFPVLRGLASFYTYRAEFDKGAQVGREILLLAEAQDDPSMRVDGHLVLGSSIALQRDLHVAWSIWRRPWPALSRRAFGRADSGSVLIQGRELYSFGARSVDTRFSRSCRGTRDSCRHPCCRSGASLHAGLCAVPFSFLHLWRQEPETVQDRALRVLQVAEEHDLQIWKALGRCLSVRRTRGLGGPRTAWRRSVTAWICTAA
jgi:hypothetical protein